MQKKKEKMQPENTPYIYERVVAKHGCTQFLKKLLRWVLWAALFGLVAGVTLLFVLSLKPEAPVVMPVNNEKIESENHKYDLASSLDAYKQVEETFVTLSVGYGASSLSDDGVMGIRETFGVMIAESFNKYYMLTSAEELTNAEIISLKIEERLVEAAIESVNQIEDIAVVSVEKMAVPDEISYQLISFGSSEELKLGDTIIAAGSPYVFSGSVNYGHIVYIGTEECCDGSRKMICTDMLIPSDSHGVFLNQNGRIVAWILQSQEDGLNNLICGAAIEEMYQMIERMIGGEEIAYLGISGREITEKVAEEYDIPEGFNVTMVAENSPAKYAGFQPGDFVISLNGQPIRNSSQLNLLLTEMEVDDSVTVELKRLGQDGYEMMTVEAILGKR